MNKRRNYSEWEEDRQELEALGYTVSELMFYHFRVSQPDAKFTVDVWPGTKKMKPSNGRTIQYRDAILSIRDLFFPPWHTGLAATIRKSKPSPNKQARALWKEYYDSTRWIGKIEN